MREIVVSFGQLNGRRGRDNRKDGGGEGPQIPSLALQRGKHRRYGRSPWHAANFAAPTREARALCSHLKGPKSQ